MFYFLNSKESFCNMIIPAGCSFNIYINPGAGVELCWQAD